MVLFVDENMGTRDINSFGTKGNGERLYDDSVAMEKGKIGWQMFNTKTKI